MFDPGYLSVYFVFYLASFDPFFTQLDSSVDYATQYSYDGNICCQPIQLQIDHQHMAVQCCLIEALATNLKAFFALPLLKWPTDIYPLSFTF